VDLCVCCSIKPSKEDINSDNKYLTGLQDSNVDDGLSLSMVCDEEVISADVNSKHYVGAMSAPKRSHDENIKSLDVGLTKKPIVIGTATSHTVKTVCLSQFELEGLTAVLEWLESLPVGRRNVPKDIPEPDALLSDVRVSRIHHLY